MGGRPRELQVSTLTHGDPPSAKQKKELTEQENSLELDETTGKVRFTSLLTV